MNRFYSIFILLLLAMVLTSADASSTQQSKYPEMITIPAGDFLMGNPGYGPFAPAQTFPQHSVKLNAYQIGKYEVTRGEYRTFIDDGGYSKKEYWSEDGWKWKIKEKRIQPRYWKAEQDLGFGSFVQTEQHPVTGVSYYEAEAYCKWAGGRLPTEAEWEKAGCWDEKTQLPHNYPWGNDYSYENSKTDNNYTNPVVKGRGYKTYPVGNHPEGASFYGLMDMAGNAYEWCADWYVSYPGNNDVFDGTNKFRAVRGGNWYGGESGNQVNYRQYNSPDKSWFSSGFRLAK